MQTTGIDGLIAQLRASAALASGQPIAGGASPSGPAGAADFMAALKSALDQVSVAQQGALDQARSFETGATSVSLHEVMISMQKANIAFQGVVQVRNKLVSAYQDVMNMQI